MNPLDFLRLRNIFQVPQGPIGNDLPSQGGITGNMRVPPDIFQQPPLPQPSPMRVPPTTPPIVEEPEPTPAIFSSTTKSPRQYPISDKYFETIDTMPERGKPSWWRVLLGAPAALGPNGGQAMDQIVHQPYYDKMRDWGTKNKILGDMAKIEGDINQQRSLDEYRDETAEARMMTAEAAQERAAIQREMLNGGIVKTNLAGEMFIVTRDGRVRKLGERTLSEEEKLKLQQEGRLQVIDAQEDAALKRIAAAGEWRIKNTRESGVQTRQNINAREGATTSDTQLTRRYLNRVNELKIAHPEMAEYVKVNPNTNEIQIVFPQDTWLNPFDKELGRENEETLRRQIYDYIYKGKEIEQMPTEKIAPPPAAQGAPAPAATITRPDNTGVPNTPAPVRAQGTPNSRKPVVGGKTHMQWRQAATDYLKANRKQVTEETIELVAGRMKDAAAAKK